MLAKRIKVWIQEMQINAGGSIWIQVWTLSLSTAFETFVYGLDIQEANRGDFKDPRFGLDL
jgi:hypothetical protein